MGQTQNARPLHICTHTRGFCGIMNPTRRRSLTSARQNPPRNYIAFESKIILWPHENSVFQNSIKARPPKANICYCSAKTLLERTLCRSSAFGETARGTGLKRPNRWKLRWLGGDRGGIEWTESTRWTAYTVRTFGQATAGLERELARGLAAIRSRSSLWPIEVISTSRSFGEQ